MLGMSFKLEKIGPFGKNPSLVNICFMHFFKNCPTLTMHNSLNFDSLEVFLDFLEILRCPLSKTFGLISFWYSILMYEALTKKSVFVDFSKWPIMSKFITSYECIFLTWELKMDYRELNPIKNELWMGHFS